MALAPTPEFAERAPTEYQRQMAADRPGNRGPLRFEEGVATDTDVPDDFQAGMADGYAAVPGRPNHKPNVMIQPAEKTIQQRAHVGSAAWIEAPTVLGEFAHGSFNDYAEVTYEEVTRPGRRMERINPTVVDG